MDASELKEYIFGMLFLKRCSDVFERIVDSELLDFNDVLPLVDKLRELAKANSYKLEQE